MMSSSAARNSALSTPIVSAQPCISRVSSISVSPTSKNIARIGIGTFSVRRGCKFGERRGDSLIHLAAERHDQIGDAIKPFPAPLVELRRLAVARRQRVDLVVAPGEPQREPLLALAAEFGEAMRGWAVIGRKLVSHPAGFAEMFGADRAGLFPEFAHHGIARILVGV